MDPLSTNVTLEDINDLVATLQPKAVGICEMVVTSDRYIWFDFPDGRSFFTPLGRTKGDAFYELTNKLSYYTDAEMAHAMMPFVPVFAAWAYQGGNQK